MSKNEVLAVYYGEDPRSPGESISKRDFEIIKMIGKGGFSTVYEGNFNCAKNWVVRHKATGRMYAMKVINKDSLEKEKKVKQVMNEKTIMEKLEHPSIVKLHWAFQSKKKLHFILDFCAGGEFFYHLHNVGRLSEVQARFYFAEIVLGLEYLHQRGIIYRDLKPENVLLDLNGHVRLADFGLSKSEINLHTLTTSFCGSPEYMSPEMLLQTGHTLTVDYYSLGALVYEMIIGLPPYYSTNRDEMYDHIVNSPLRVPSYMSRELKSLLTGLLNKNPAERLGSKRGIEEIKEHPWCSDIPWDLYLDHKVEPPFKPDLQKSHFDPEYTNCPVQNPDQKAERSYSCYWEGNSESQDPIDQSDASSMVDTQRQKDERFRGFSFTREEHRERMSLGPAISGTEDFFCANIPSIERQNETPGTAKKDARIFSSGELATSRRNRATSDSQLNMGDVTEKIAEEQKAENIVVCGTGQGPGRILKELALIEMEERKQPIEEESSLYDSSMFSVAQEYKQGDSAVKMKVSATPMRKKDFGALVTKNAPEEEKNCKSIVQSPLVQAFAGQEPGYLTQAQTPSQRNKLMMVSGKRTEAKVEGTKKVQPTKEFSLQPEKKVKEKAKHILSKMLSPKDKVNPKPQPAKSKENHLTTLNQTKTPAFPSNTSGVFIERIGKKAQEMMHRATKELATINCIRSAKNALRGKPIIEANRPKAIHKGFMNGPLFKTTHLNHPFVSVNTTSNTSRQTIVCATSAQSRNLQQKSKDTGLPTTNTLADVSSQLNVQKSFDKKKNDVGKACFNYVNEEQKRINEFASTVLNSQKTKVQPKATKQPAASKKLALNIGKVTVRNTPAAYKTMRGKTNSSKDVTFAAGKTVDEEMGRQKPMTASGISTSREGSVGQVTKRSNSSRVKKKVVGLSHKNSAHDGTVLSTKGSQCTKKLIAK